jgi:hypothetical protein
MCIDSYLKENGVCRLANHGWFCRGEEDCCISSIEIPTENAADVAHPKVQEVACDVLLPRQSYEVDRLITHISVLMRCLSWFYSLCCLGWRLTDWHKVLQDLIKPKQSYANLRVHDLLLHSRLGSLRGLLFSMLYRGLSPPFLPASNTGPLWRASRKRAGLCLIKCHIYPKTNISKCEN